MELKKLTCGKTAVQGRQKAFPDDGRNVVEEYATTLEDITAIRYHNT
jgi:hypothetical protein